MSAATDVATTIGRVYQSSVTVWERGVNEGSAPLDAAGRAATSAPAIDRVNSLISRAIDEGASDLHFEPEADFLAVRARIDGVMRQSSPRRSRRA